MSTFLLVPSPLLGPATWEPTATWLHATGHGAVIASVDRIVSVATGLTDRVLVVHSNAGYRASSLAEQLGAVATIYVDAALPPLGASETALAPPDLLEFLAGIADTDGLLPPWTEWWDDLGDLFPDEATRIAVEFEQPRLPLDYFRQLVPVAADWAAEPCGYLAFGSTYVEEIELAREQHWPLVVLDGEHLHQLHDPAGVAAAIVALAEELGR